MEDTKGFAEAVRTLVDLGRRQERPSVIKIEDGSRRFALRDDTLEQYVLQSAELRPEIVITQLDSFFSFVGQYEGEGGAAAGEFPCVLFGNNGAVYYPNVNDPRTAVKYERRTSAGYNATSKATDGNYLDHHGFQKMLRALRPWMEKAPEVIRAFGKVLFERNLNITSAPTLTEGKGGLTYAIDYTVKGTNGQTSLPSEIVMVFPFSEGSTLPPMQVTLDVDIAIGVENEREKSLKFALLWPEKGEAVERAIAAEMSWFGQNVPDVLVLAGR